MERRQDVSVVRLYDVLLERHNDVSKWRNDDAPSLRLHEVLIETPNDVSAVRIHDVPLARLYEVSGKSKTPKNVVVVCLHQVSELRFTNVLLVGLYYNFKLLCRNLHLVGF